MAMIPFEESERIYEAELSKLLDFLTEHYGVSRESLLSDTYGKGFADIMVAKYEEAVSDLGYDNEKSMVYGYEQAMKIAGSNRKPKKK